MYNSDGMVKDIGRNIATGMWENSGTNSQKKKNLSQMLERTSMSDLSFLYKNEVELDIWVKRRIWLKFFSSLRAQQTASKSVIWLLT